ncbi:unnamed protein product [Rotaria sp. Silwood2]|nr:unnamed protein product [Rotaria sp. Silwood2]CAF3051713.1 unnamed protein product [Rotaria sp. Silwood2]CAF3212271.1 unnamed protein product [Rotaria sp. Silwood2]CAF4140409.1 unnamed protein product [Rotaria sp. Silwood2]CAF4206866.1 unnamed protein product [Rotaria sp. Silwood2]
MRLYTLYKRQFFVVFVLFFICLFIIILITTVGPSVIQLIDYKSKNLTEQLFDPYELQSEYVHQRLWLSMKTMTDINNDFHQLINVNISVNNSSSNARVYIHQRIIHCQKQVSIKQKISCNSNNSRR